MNALGRTPEKLEVPQYEFLDKRVAAEKGPIRVPFLCKGDGYNALDAKPLRTHVCVVDRQVLFIGNTYTGDPL